MILALIFQKIRFHGFFDQVEAWMCAEIKKFTNCFRYLVDCFRYFAAYFMGNTHCYTVEQNLVMLKNRDFRVSRNCFRYFAALPRWTATLAPPRRRHAWHGQFVKAAPPPPALCRSTTVLEVLPASEFSPCPASPCSPPTKKPTTFFAEKVEKSRRHCGARACGEKLHNLSFASHSSFR